MPTTTKKNRPKKVAADRGGTTDSPEALASRGKVIAKVAPQSPLWKGAVQQTGLDVIAACAQVDEDDTSIKQIELALDAAKNLKIHHVVEAVSKFDVYATTLEDTVTTPKEMQDLGVDPLSEHKYELVAPIRVTASSDPALHDISAVVERAAGLRRCVIEVSADLTMATGVKSFPGDGARQSMGPFAPGIYAVRAAHTRAAQRSVYTDIVTVVVK